MTPEARDYLAKAGEELAEARAIMGIGLAKAAARGAYYAAFHAAQALLVARTGRIAKTHTGVRTALAQLPREGSPSDRDLLTFLARAYKYKEIGDYGVGPGIVITIGDAENLLAGADRFVARVTALLETDTAVSRSGWD